MPWHLPAPLMAYECCYGNTASSYPECLCMAHSTVRYHNTLKGSYVVSSVTSSKLFHRFCCARVFVRVCSACLHTCVMLFPSQQNASIHKSTEAYFDLAVFSFPVFINCSFPHNAHILRLYLERQVTEIMRTLAWGYWRDVFGSAGLPQSLLALLFPSQDIDFYDQKNEREKEHLMGSILSHHRWSDSSIPDQWPFSRVKV